MSVRTGSLFHRHSEGLVAYAHHVDAGLLHCEAKFVAAACFAVQQCAVQGMEAYCRALGRAFHHNLPVVRANAQAGCLMSCYAGGCLDGQFPFRVFGGLPVSVTGLCGLYAGRSLGQTYKEVPAFGQSDAARLGSACDKRYG